MTTATKLIRASSRVVRRLASTGLSYWRGSLQLRVTATTFLLSSIVVVGVGVALVNQVTNGLLQAKTRSALTELSSGLTIAEDHLYAVPNANSFTVAGEARSLPETLSKLAAGTPNAYGVALVSSLPSVGAVATGVQVSSVPAVLARRVAASAGAGVELYTYTTLRYDDGTTTPGLVAGVPVAVPPQNRYLYQLYYLFPLRQEAQTVQLVRGTLIVSGLALIAFLVGLTWLVTRQVVTPVRLAARTAQRLAGGHLEERMAVRGEDDLARLAQSFNRMAENLQRQIGRLERLSRVQRRFVADVSHELRTPLSTVRMAADVLHAERSVLPAEAGRASELLQAQLDRFEELLFDLLEISRHDAGAAVLEVEHVELGALVRRVVAAYEPLAAARGIEIHTRLPDEPIVVEADPRRVDRILRNLLSNAVEYGAEQPVEVQLAAADGAAAVVVADRGIGLRPGEASLVFNRFWRSDPSRARTTGGTGLGLSIALQDARLHGGWLQAWGEPGRGSRFRLTLPLQARDVVDGSPLPLALDETASTSGEPIG